MEHKFSPSAKVFFLVIILLSFIAISLLYRIFTIQNQEPKESENKKDIEIEQLKETVNDLKTQLDQVLEEPTPTPQVIYKYIENKTDNSQKLKKIDEQIVKAREEIAQLEEKLKENPYSQNNQARIRDLKYQITQMEIEKIKYE